MTAHSTPAVVNHSGGFFPWDTASKEYSTRVRNMVEAVKLPYFTSADNWSADACDQSPNDQAYTKANTTGSVFVVGGTTSGDARWQGAPLGSDSGSNSGSCISAWAPAQSIYVAWNGLLQYGVLPNNVYRTLTGTSFSSPLAAAMALRYMVKENNAGRGIPRYWEVYDFLLNRPVATASNTNTPGYWACYDTSSGHYLRVGASAQDCLPDGAYWMEAVGNPTGATILNWDNDTCTLP